MILGELVWGAPDWWPIAVALGCAAALTLLVSYLRAGSAPVVRICAATLKAAAVVSLLLCLLEPLFSGKRPRPGANLFLMLADDSQSLTVNDQKRDQTRGEELKELLMSESAWQTQLGQDFDVRRYTFGNRLDAVNAFEDLTFEESRSALRSSLDTIAQRFRERPVAGVLLFTDGNLTDGQLSKLSVEDLPPVYPVVVGAATPQRDVSVIRVRANQSNFESAPVTVEAQIRVHGLDGEDVAVQLLDETGEILEQQLATTSSSKHTLNLRFQVQPQHSGVGFYSVRACVEREVPLFKADGDLQSSLEATTANNSRLVIVDRGGGPYRILYVAGRPNWEFKFLRRSIQEDREVELVGLVRIAKREPRMEFRSRRGESTNPLFRGFGNAEDETAEQYDEPVLLRLGTRDERELSAGFPTAADQLYEYDALIFDDLEASYFTGDQMSLIQEFVSRRGGGLLMLGGEESFYKGKYHRTPVGEMLPVYVDREPKPPENLAYRFALTAEGWLQPWVRVRSTEEGERQRLNAMPEFESLNRVAGLKPGATILAQAMTADGQKFPALVTQRFGKGRVSALLVGDFWRWAMQREAGEQTEMEQAWRQKLRWLVADVPRRVQVDAQPVSDDPTQAIQVDVRPRNELFEPLDNATVAIAVKTPDGRTVEVNAAANDEELGLYRTTYLPREPGAYRATVRVTALDGSQVGERDIGWISEPATDEFRELEPNRAVLQRLAKRTGGEVVEASALDGFVADLPNRRIPVTEPWVYPLWHQWSVFVFAVICLTGEWGLRRWKGMP